MDFSEIEARAVAHALIDSYTEKCLQFRSATREDVMRGLVVTLARDHEDKIRTCLIELGWTPPDTPIGAAWTPPDTPIGAAWTPPDTPIGAALGSVSADLIKTQERIKTLELSVREQALGEQDGYLLSIADQLREIIDDGTHDAIRLHVRSS
jgi:hypothetical protein